MYSCSEIYLKISNHKTEGANDIAGHTSFLIDREKIDDAGKHLFGY